ncbi:MAG: hypothetical protein H6738_22050 [Alphaproteobacteria bacterium]|nr:hypothetical protein [Alphaproteobacteria bacterium]MCB9699482.1 hypothetical protein [Alphaproteobacteria bacterium]
MLLEGALFAAGLTLTVVLGAPVASRLARPTTWSWLKRPVAQVPDRPRIETPRAFAPLDLGPDPMRWPSQRPWAASPIPEPQWPSQSWDDEHFGAHWRRADAAAPPPPVSQMAPGASTPALWAAEEQFFKLDPLQPRLQEAERAEPPPPPRPQPTAARPAKQPQAARKPAPQAQKAAQPKPQQRPQQPTATKPVPKPAARPATPKAAPKAAPRPASAAGVPDKAELEAMVAQIGLAATVQKIMERTGWDFRQAAQHLARIRQGQ